VLDPSQLSVISESGEHVLGPKPSKTIALHRRIYEADASARCVIHTHSRQLVAASLAASVDGKVDGADGEFIPPITPYFVMKVGHVPLIPYFAPGDARAADLVHSAIVEANAIGRPIRAVMLDRLGPNVWGGSPAAAMATLEELEETAFLWNASGHRATPLDDAAIDELRERFGANW
jgi:ribulose-5-phosphate 4-epimerase/fuculose-1-phosphate aldolase